MSEQQKFHEVSDEEADEIYRFSQHNILTNEMICRWLRNIEGRLRRLESKSSRKGETGVGRTNYPKPNKKVGERQHG